MGTSVSVFLDQEEVKVPLDPDAPDFTYFLSLSISISETSIIPHPETKYELYLINSGFTPSIKQGNAKFNPGDCSFPFQAVEQSEWRAGLDAPDYKRSFTNVNHVVVHHSAGSNSSTNYTQVVRDIYLFHTQVNGWSDIGYNYLIAQDGTIYTGRDPGEGGEQDNVMGAHFCGSNSTTMGVCLLGDYQTAHPAEDSWGSLQQLVAFKLKKENLDPLQTHLHPLGNLGSLIGHRDGCSRLCPGENVFARLDDLRDRTAQLFNDCEPDVTAVLDFTINQTSPEPYEEVFFTNSSEGYERFKWIFEGGSPDTAYWTGNGSVKYHLPGNYDVKLVGYRGEITDTLHRRHIISVESAPVIHPNPALANNVLHISTHEYLSEVGLFGLSGVGFTLNELEKGRYILPNLRSGIYIVQLKTKDRTYSKKLYIQ